MGTQYVSISFRWDEGGGHSTIADDCEPLSTYDEENGSVESNDFSSKEGKKCFFLYFLRSIGNIFTDAEKSVCDKVLTILCNSIRTALWQAI